MLIDFDLGHRYIYVLNILATIIHPDLMYEIMNNHNVKDHLFLGIISYESKSDMEA